jgi:hypothetical protein
VARQDPLLDAAVEVPDLDRPVVARRRELAVERGDGDGLARLRVGLHLRLLRHLVRPVLDDADAVAGDEELPRVGVGHPEDGVLVRGHDRVEVEGRAVPEGELARLVARRHAATVGGVDDGVDDGLDAVRARVREARRDVVRDGDGVRGGGEDLEKREGGRLRGEGGIFG